ncbi:hypothetical protein BJ878DRAFT_536971 [Calycina marina]|uniref:Uncharacterized protein n=1 Tax=Calycina marina TaxID=1763456 RepID=A0A9P8CBL4_9HELO|nr:hypothetical protein BJ878DRAFT_536971 [Calycina marina]
MGLRRHFQSHPYTISWWDDSMNVTTLSFLVQPHSGISADMISRSSLRNVSIDGPYGKDLQLHKCETAILVAKGIGIAGILSYVRHMTYRRVLEDNTQQEWIAEWLALLQERDSEKA